MRGILQVGPVWLTAVMTFAAGLPHIHCQCPGGTRKLVCLPSTTRAALDCCDHCCCQTHATSRVADVEEPSGCCGQARPIASGQGRPCAIGCTGCRKTLATVEPAVLGGTKETVTEKWTAALSTGTPEPSLAAGGPASRNEPLISQPDRIPPPDRIIVFRHFVI